MGVLKNHQHDGLFQGDPSLPAGCALADARLDPPPSTALQT
jgi:hypothetical protein